MSSIKSFEEATSIWARLCEQANRAKLGRYTARQTGCERIDLGTLDVWRKPAFIEFDDVEGTILVYEPDGTRRDLPCGPSSTIISVLEFVHLFGFAPTARLVEEDANAPAAWSVWRGHDVIGYGPSALRAIRSARANVTLELAVVDNRTRMQSLEGAS